MSLAKPLVSIIMPAYNAGRFIADAIHSVLCQTEPAWELIIVDDGSTDDTAQVVNRFLKDSRIGYVYQPNQGVSKARNLALQRMMGQYFCFLDADDILPMQSISSRLAVFASNPAVAFVDGKVVAKDLQLKNITRCFLPRFTGNPYPELKSLSGSCFYGITWMIRRVPGFAYAFQEDRQYAEDLLFYLSIAHHGDYAYVNEPVYINRQVATSAMQNLAALAAGYQQLLLYLLQHHNYSFSERLRLEYKVRVLIGKLLLRNFYNEQKKRFNLRLL